jgi:hypothetical protein
MSSLNVGSFLRRGWLGLLNSLAASAAASAAAAGLATSACAAPPPGADNSLAAASATSAAAAASTAGIGRACDRRGTYVGGLPADLLLLAGALCAAVLLLLPNLFTPFVLLGLIDARTPFVLQAALIGLLLVALVGGSVARVAASLRRRRHRALVIALGGVCVSGLIAFQAAASAYSFDGFAPAAVEPALFSTDALLAHAAACLVCWTVARSSHAPAAHLAHYVATTLLFNALCCRLLIALERHDPVSRNAGIPVFFPHIISTRNRADAAYVATIETSPFS